MRPLSHFVGTQTATSHEFVATLCAIASLGLCLVGLVYALLRWYWLPSASESLSANDTLNKAFDLRLELSGKLFDLGLLLLAVLWGFVIADKVVYNFSRWQ